jgi:aryl-alcohol dehydrogenase-like predicted oxidoreductase
LVDICLEAGGNFLDNADIYSDSASESLLGTARDGGVASRRSSGNGAVVWSPLRWGRPTGKIHRGWPLPAGSPLLQRPTVATVLIGARNESQLRDNLGAVGWNLTTAQVR